MISCVDVFCGVGGLSYGLAQSGVTVEAGIDFDHRCEFAFRANNKGQFLHMDVAEVTGDEVRALWKNEVKLLAGCAPCQPFSTYSRSGRESRDDDKWSLLRHFSRLVSESSPDLITMENVPQLMHHPVFSEFLTSLDGYHIWHAVVECARYGVPQSRKRLVLLASRFGEIKFPDPMLDEQEVPTVHDAIGHLPRLAAGSGSTLDRMHCTQKLSHKNLLRIRASTPGGTWRDWPRDLRANCHKKVSGATFPSVYGRMEWYKPSPTITTQCFGYGSGRFGHPKQDRAISLREAAILQTFPETYVFLRDGEKPVFHIHGRLIGNAVPVRLGEVLGQTFVDHVSACGVGTD